MSKYRVTVLANADLIAEIFKPAMPGVWQRTDRGVPYDAKLIGCGYDWESQRFFFVFEHPSFPEAVEGERLPQFDGIGMTSFMFESPASEKAIADLNRLTTKQIALQQVEGQQEFVRQDWRVLPRYDPNHLADAAGVQPDSVTGE